LDTFQLPNLDEFEDSYIPTEKWVQFVESTDGRLLISLEKMYGKSTGRILVVYPCGRTRSINRAEAQYYLDEGSWSICNYKLGRAIY